MTITSSIEVKLQRFAGVAIKPTIKRNHLRRLENDAIKVASGKFI
jgi:hypothetical protein